MIKSTDCHRLTITTHAYSTCMSSKFCNDNALRRLAIVCHYFCQYDVNTLIILT